jgi:hypothetical protein
MCCKKKCEGHHNDCIHPEDRPNPKDCTPEQVRLCHGEDAVRDHPCEK